MLILCNLLLLLLITSEMIFYFFILNYFVSYLYHTFRDTQLKPITEYGPVVNVQVLFVFGDNNAGQSGLWAIDRLADVDNRLTIPIRESRITQS